jgi:hypothetical protein
VRFRIIFKAIGGAIKPLPVRNASASHVDSVVDALHTLDILHGSQCQLVQMEVWQATFDGQDAIEKTASQGSERLVRTGA